MKGLARYFFMQWLLLGLLWSKSHVALNTTTTTTTTAANNTKDNGLYEIPALEQELIYTDLISGANNTITIKLYPSQASYWGHELADICYLFQLDSDAIASLFTARIEEYRQQHNIIEEIPLELPPPLILDDDVAVGVDSNYNNYDNDKETTTTTAELALSERNYNRQYGRWQLRLNRFSATVKLHHFIEHVQQLKEQQQQQQQQHEPQHEPQPSQQPPQQQQKQPEQQPQQQQLHGNISCLDFGSGSGHLLSALNCDSATGVDISKFNRRYGRQRLKLHMVSRLSELPSNAFDFAYSTHALEHTECPVCEVRQLLRVLKHNATFIGIVPGMDQQSMSYDPKDMNLHLGVFGAQEFGNVLRVAGFEVRSCESQYSQWPRHFEKELSQLGETAFRQRCVEWSLAHDKSIETKCIAVKPPLVNSVTAAAAV